jgi:hypothetical protein
MIRRRKQQKINFRELLVEYLSIYTLTIVVTIIIQSMILQVSIETLLTCLLKSMFTNLVSATLVMVGLRIPIIKSHILLMALAYALSNIPYIDILIIHTYEPHLSLLKIIGSYSLSYFVLGFFIDKIVGLSKNLFNKIINNEWKSSPKSGSFLVFGF